MSFYRLIDRAVWSDERIQQCSKDARSLFLYLCCNEHDDLCGVYRLSVAAVVEDTAITAKEFHKSMAQLDGLELAHYDPVSRIVWVTNMLYKQARTTSGTIGSKHIQHTVKQLEVLPRSPIKTRMVSYYADRYGVSIPYDIGVDTPIDGGASPQPSVSVSVSGSVSGSVKPAKKARKEADLPPFPPVLDTPPFRAAWGAWLNHRQEIKHKITPGQAKAQLKKLSRVGPDTAVSMIDQSIENGWRGLFEPKEGNSNPSTPPDMAKREEELRVQERASAVKREQIRADQDANRGDITELLEKTSRKLRRGQPKGEVDTGQEPN